MAFLHCNACWVKTVRLKKFEVLVTLWLGQVLMHWSRDAYERYSLRGKIVQKDCQLVVIDILAGFVAHTSRRVEDRCMFGRAIGSEVH